MLYIHNLYADTKLPKRYTVNYQQVYEAPLLITRDVNVPCGAGAHMFSTGEDLLKWNYALHSGKILKPESFNLMRKIHISTEDSYYLGKFSYGYGIIIDNIGGHNIYSHPGNIAGITTYLSYDPSNQLGISIMSNFSISNSVNSPRHPGRVLFGLIENIHRELRGN